MLVVVVLSFVVKLKEGLFKMAGQEKRAYEANINNPRSSTGKEVAPKYLDKSLQLQKNDRNEATQSSLDKMDAGMLKARIDAAKPTGPKLDTMPSDIADKLQDMKNQKGAADYEKTKSYKKGGKTTAKCMARGGGIEIRGKTKGRFV